MKGKKFDAVEMKRRLQREAELKLAPLSQEEQLEVLRNRFRHLVRKRVS